MSGFWMKTAQGNDVHINGDPNMSEAMVQALAAAKQMAEKPNPYLRIGETLVAVDELKKIIAILIDDYTVEKLIQDGSLIDVELLNFHAWINAKYPG